MTSSTALVLSELTLDAIQAEATRAHLKHGDHSMLGTNAMAASWVEYLEGGHQ